MDNLDTSESNAKVSDSGYSNSCSNSQSRRSHSSKSTHSGSNASGSSGYGGKPSTFASSLDQSSKKDKKKQQQPLSEVKPEEAALEECRPPEPVPPCVEPKEDNVNVVETPPPAHAMQLRELPESMEISQEGNAKEEDATTSMQTVTSPVDLITSRPNSPSSSNGFSCVISMHDGVVMYTTSSLTATLGFPKDMWIGRSFIDFVHPRDRNTFASQITDSLAVPKLVNGTQEKAQWTGKSGTTVVCRIRRYRSLTTGFGIKERFATFMPFFLKFNFKNVSEEDGKSIYLVIQASPFHSAFKVANEVVTKPVPFVIRHDAKGHIEYIDPESVSYLGYLPQDVLEKDALQMYHPDDLPYLKQIYENIVKKGIVARSRPYRMMTQNGHYLKLETEWSSFINLWSMKLEFVIGKHHILEGPSNPDVFQSPEPIKHYKVSEEEKNKAQSYRDTIIRIMNDVLTKPAEDAKQQMSKRCQDLAVFMESLLDEQPKSDDELRPDRQEVDHSYYERDSVMLGGISPHHDYNDSKSSTETPLSYTQLNYNETLQRYFDSHQPLCHEDHNAVTGGNVGLRDVKTFNSECRSPMAMYSSDSNELSSCESSGRLMMMPNTSSYRDYQPARLTETLLLKHNAEMEKELVKMHRETRTGTKGEREETRKKKKEHLARCNATFQPTLAGAATTTTESPVQPHGVKRSSKHIETESGTHKHHCPTRHSRRRQQGCEPAATITTTATTHWPANHVGSMNTFIVGVGIPQQMSLMSHMPSMPGVFPMYYTPATAPSPAPGPSSSNAASNHRHSGGVPPFPGPHMQCMMYGQPLYGSPFVYSPINQQVSYPLQQTVMAQTMHYTNTLNPLGLTHNNYQEACKTSLPMTPSKSVAAWREKRRAESQTTTDHGSGGSSSNALHRGRCRAGRSISQSTDAVLDTCASRQGKFKMNRNSEEAIDRTDGESSYSSFYSSFFKTESGSAEENGDARKSQLDGRQRNEAGASYYEPLPAKKVARRKTDPPWMEQVCVTSELIYKYQIMTKTKEEVLRADKEKMSNLKQPALVNEQLGQLYLDLQLEGVAARLTLEEGITSSSSSGEETTTKTKTAPRKKREYSKLVMIYEEDAPLPPPSEPSCSTSHPKS